MTTTALSRVAALSIEDLAVLYDRPIPPAVTVDLPPEVLLRIDPPGSAGSETCPVKRKQPCQQDAALVQYAREAKELEWTQVFRAMRTIFFQWFDTLDTPYESLTPPQLIALMRYVPVSLPEKQFEQRLVRFFLSSCRRSRIQPPENLLEIVRGYLGSLRAKENADFYDELQRLTELFFEVQGIKCESAILKDQFHQELLELATEYEECVRNSDQFRRQDDKFWDYIQTLVELLVLELPAKSDAKPIVLTALYKIRDALDCTVYKLYKTNEVHPGVNLLHNLCQALYAHAEVLPAYEYLGKKTCQTAGIIDSSSLHYSLQKVWKSAFQHGISKDDPKNKDSLWTRISKSCQFLLDSITRPMRPELAIQNWWKSFAGYSAQFKDHHAFFENNPGVIAEEQFRSSRRIYSARTVTSASPACGKEVVPEFLGLLQALENRHFYPNLPNIYSYSKVAYSNLQSKKGAIEGLQTEAIMALNAKYPFSFSGITISQEPIEGEELTVDLVNRVFQKLISDENFALRSIPGYYFPPQDRRKWELALKKIVTKSYDSLTSRTGKRAVTAFGELVNLGIIRYHEMKVLHSTASQHGKMLSMRICQAGVDRAGIVTGAFLWALLSKLEISRIYSVIFGRAVLAKGRLPLLDKLNRLESLAGAISHEAILQYLQYIDSLATNSKLSSRSIRLIGID